MADAEALEVRRLQSQLATMSAQNDRLVRTLKDAREQLVNLKAEVDRLASPPAAYGVVLEVHADGTADIATHPCPVMRTLHGGGLRIGRAGREKRYSDQRSSYAVFHGCLQFS